MHHIHQFNARIVLKSKYSIEINQYLVIPWKSKAFSLAWVAKCFDWTGLPK